jgi:Lrp/AsnC family transcriptional regulator
MDSIDRKILSLLQTDASLSIQEIAKHVHLSSTPCWKRIQRLEKTGVIRARVALLDPRKVNADVTVLVSIQTTQHTKEWIEKFARIVSEMPEVMEIYRMSGDVDYLLRVVVPDIASYDHFYKKLTAKIDLHNVTSHFAMEQIKYTTALPINEAKEA